MTIEIEIPAHELEGIHARAASDFSVIKSADLKGASLTYTYEETIHEITDTVKRAAGSPIHKDLQKAFRALSAHLAVIVEDILPEAIEAHPLADIERFENIPDYDENGKRIYNSELEAQIGRYTIDGVQLSKAGVTLSGNIELSTGELVNITTPRLKWDESKYHFLNELMAAIDTLKDEIRLYKNGKSAPMARQTDLFEEEMQNA